MEISYVAHLRSETKRLKARGRTLGVGRARFSYPLLLSSLLSSFNLRLYILSLSLPLIYTYILLSLSLSLEAPIFPSMRAVSRKGASIICKRIRNAWNVVCDTPLRRLRASDPHPVRIQTHCSLTRSYYLHLRVFVHGRGWKGSGCPLKPRGIFSLKELSRARLPSLCLGIDVSFLGCRVEFHFFRYFILYKHCTESIVIQIQWI